MSEQKRILNYALGISAFLHVVIIGIFTKTMALLLIPPLAVLLLVVLWRATTGRRAPLFTGLGLAIVIEAVGWGVAYYSGITVAEKEEELIRFQAPPPILQKNFDLAKQPEISEVQMEMIH